jgi:exosortase family protein XrtF
MKAFFKTSAFTKFVVASAFIYILLYLIYQFVVKRYTLYDQQFIGSIIQSSDAILKILGYKTFMVLQDRDMQVIGIDGSSGVWVGSNCNAITLFGLFAVFIAAYPGHQKNKWWYIPAGIIAIHILNIVRVVCLSIIALYSPYSLDFNHTYTFTFLIYAFIFLLWMTWVNKFANRVETTHEGKN